MLPGLSGSFELCAPSNSDLGVAPNCPFTGETGDVWVKPAPASGDLVDWGTRCKVGTDCNQSWGADNILSNLQNLVSIVKDTGIDIELDAPELVNALEIGLHDAGIQIEVDSFSSLLGLSDELWF
jgi:hypothetical protein